MEGREQHAAEPQNNPRARTVWVARPEVEVWLPTGVECETLTTTYVSGNPSCPRTAKVGAAHGRDGCRRSTQADAVRGRQGGSRVRPAPAPPQGEEQMSKTIPIRIRKGQVIEALVDDEDVRAPRRGPLGFATGKVAPVRIGTVGGRKTSVTLARDVVGVAHRGDPRSFAGSTPRPRLPPGEPCRGSGCRDGAGPVDALPRGRDRGGGPTRLEARWIEPV